MSEIQQLREKKPDEIFCSSCGMNIKKLAEICPKCGVRIKKTGDGFSVASLVLGIVGLVFFGGLVIPGILGFVFGIIGIKSEKRGMAIAGIVLNSIQIFIIIFFIILIILIPLTILRVLPFCL